MECDSLSDMQIFNMVDGFMKQLYHSLPMWVWEVAVLLSYLGLFILSVIVAICVIGGDEGE